MSVATNLRTGSPGDPAPRWKILAVYGMPGVGKSHFARVLFEAYRTTHHGRKEIVTCDPPCAEPVTLAGVASMLAAKLIGPAMAGVEPEACLQALRSVLSGPGNLLVVDGLGEGLARR